MNTFSVINATFTLIAIVATCFIYYRILKAEKESLRLGLYDKRFAYYLEVRKFLFELTQHSIVEVKSIPDRWSSLFLFEKEDVHDYIKEIIKKAIDHKFLSEEVKSEISRHNNGQQCWYTPDEWNKKCEDNSELAIWFHHEYEGLHNRFMKYLDFHNEQPLGEETMITKIISLLPKKHKSITVHN